MAFKPLMTKDREEILAEVNEKFDRSARARMGVEGQWYRNMSFYLGRHWVVWDRKNNQLIDLSTDPGWRVRNTTNHVLNFVQSKSALLLKNRPSFNVHASSDDSSDREASRLGQQLLDNLWQKEDVLDEIRRFVYNGMIYGSGFLKVFWDPLRGPYVQDPESEDKEKPERVPLGDIAIKSISPFELYPDPESESPFLRDTSWIIHAYRMSPEEFEIIYKQEAITESLDGQGLEKQYRSMARSTGHTLNLPFEGDVDQEEEFVTIKEYWESPSAVNPLGRLVIFTRDYLLFDGEPPLGEMLPFAKFDDIFVSDRFWGSGVVEHLIPLQTEYNRTRSQILENRNLMGNPKWIAPRESIRDAEAISSEPGEIIWYSPMQGIPPPQPMAMPSIPSQLFAQEDRILSDMQSVGGISDVNLSSTPPSGVKSGRALAILAERDESRMAPTIQSFETAMAAGGKLALLLAKHFYSEERKIRILGEDSMSRVITVSQKDFGIPEDVGVTIGQGLGFSKLARVELLLEMYDRQLIQDPKRVLSLLEFGDDKDIYEEANIDRNNAQMENITMAQGQEIAPPSIVDDHNVHLESHRRFIKSEQFRALPPQGQELMIVHYQQTNEIVQQQIQAMIESQMAQGQSQNRSR